MHVAMALSHSPTIHIPQSFFMCKLMVADHGRHAKQHPLLYSVAHDQPADCNQMRRTLMPTAMAL